ncbi:major capsid protein [Candidatus Pacearchaeota archaeon]|nr:major capsid protein [Candidatus Pacearchaeota archaeon]
MPANPIDALTDRRVLNRVVNKRIKPYTALTNLLFPPSTKNNLFEETAQIDVLEGTFGMAPFVKVGQKAVIMDALNGTSYTVDTPFINIKRPLKWSTKFAKRQAGQQVFTNTDQTMAMIREAIDKDMDMLNTLIDDRIEWMVAQLLTGQISYSSEGLDSFIINSGKPVANTFSVSLAWAGGSAVPLEDIKTMKQVVSVVRGAIPNIGICGATAAAALRAMISASGELVNVIKTTSGVIAQERLNLLSRISEDGMIHIGRLGDVDFFEYLGVFNPDDGGAAEALIRTDYIEFFSVDQRAVDMREFMFGMIPDLRAIMSGQAITERWVDVDAPKFDQGTYQALIMTRPLPWFYRPDWNVSMKVTNI